MAKIVLRKRERILLVGGTILLVLVAGYIGGRGPWAKYKASAATLGEARERLQQALAMRAAVLEARRSQEIIQTRMKERGNFNLWGAVNGALRNAKLAERGADLQSKKGVASEKFAAVQLTLEGVSMEELVNLLYTIYSGNNLVVLHSLDKLTPAESGKGLTCQLTFISPKA